MRTTTAFDPTAPSPPDQHRCDPPLLRHQERLRDPLLAGALRAQQFQQVVPSAAYEGVECADVDDGDLTIVADGSGSAIQNKIFINKLVETGTPWLLVDESACWCASVRASRQATSTATVGSTSCSRTQATRCPPLHQPGRGQPGLLHAADRRAERFVDAAFRRRSVLGDVGDLDLVINDAYNGPGEACTCTSTTAPDTSPSSRRG
jgi:hypothetical protein